MREKLTVWQRSILALMLTVEKDRLEADVHSISRHAVLFPRRSLEALLDFDWQGYHTSAVRELEEQGWIITRLKSGKAEGYVLTEAAYVHLWNKHVQAISDAQTITAEQLAVPF